MTSMPTMSPPSRVIIGVDTHKHAHAAAVLDERGALLGTATFDADSAGYQALIDWSARFGRPLHFGIEGTGSYGRGLASAVRRGDHVVVEVGPTARTATVAASPICSTQKTPPALCWPAKPMRSRRPTRAPWK